MTLRLILVRHAKSSWGDPSLDDHERPLNGRGRRSAEAIGQWLAERGARPALVLSSESTRTRQTWAGIERKLGGDPAVRWERALYLSDAGPMLDVLRGAAAASPVLMLGHNPGIARFAGRIVAAAPDHARFDDYPTAATALIDFDADTWDRVGWGSGRVADFTVPRDLGVD